jgi:regulator of replication initiation timing
VSPSLYATMQDTEDRMAEELTKLRAENERLRAVLGDIARAYSATHMAAQIRAALSEGAGT